MYDIELIKAYLEYTESSLHITKDHELDEVFIKGSNLVFSVSYGYFTEEVKIPMYDLLSFVFKIN